MRLDEYRDLTPEELSKKSEIFEKQKFSRRELPSLDGLGKLPKNRSLSKPQLDARSKVMTSGKMDTSVKSAVLENYKSKTSYSSILDDIQNKVSSSEFDSLGRQITKPPVEYVPEVDEDTKELMKSMQIDEDISDMEDSDDVQIDDDLQKFGDRIHGLRILTNTTDEATKYKGTVVAVGNAPMQRSFDNEDMSKDSDSPKARRAVSMTSNDLEELDLSDLKIQREPKDSKEYLYKPTIKKVHYSSYEDEYEDDEDDEDDDGDSGLGEKILRILKSGLRNLMIQIIVALVIIILIILFIVSSYSDSDRQDRRVIQLNEQIFAGSEVEAAELAKTKLELFNEQLASEFISLGVERTLSAPMMDESLSGKDEYVSEFISHGTSVPVNISIDIEVSEDLATSMNNTLAETEPVNKEYLENGNSGSSSEDTVVNSNVPQTVTQNIPQVTIDVTVEQKPEVSYPTKEYLKSKIEYSEFKHRVSVGQKFGSLTIERLDIKNKIVRWGWQDEINMGICQYALCDMPGTKGVSLLCAHNYNPDWRIDKLRAGDKIYYDTIYGSYIYEVYNASVNYEGAYGYWLDGCYFKANSGDLVMMTCWPMNSDGKDGVRYNVFARLVSGPSVSNYPVTDFEKYTSYEDSI